MINKDYLYTRVWENPNMENLVPGSLYLFAHDPETRSKFCASSLQANNLNTTFVELEIDDQDQMIDVTKGQRVSLSSSNEISEYLKKYTPTVIYIEVTGMSCRLVAPMMSYSILNDMQVYIVYSEPQQYLLNEFKKEGIHEDLSEACRGVYPLPGFVKVLPHREDPLFVAMLGFEGGRLTYLITTQQPTAERIRPVIGMPGYRIDYPFESYWGNRNSLRTTKAWERVEYAEANSIVDSYMTLKKISADNRNPEMVIAPIGTKPHAIGAILYAIKNPRKVELLYDNPKRSLSRTDGVGRILCCDVTKLFKEN
ncbi:hypothetical protein [Prevotella koreensis]